MRKGNPHLEELQVVAEPDYDDLRIECADWRNAWWKVTARMGLPHDASASAVMHQYNKVQRQEVATRNKHYKLRNHIARLVREMRRRPVLPTSAHVEKIIAWADSLEKAADVQENYFQMEELGK